MSGDECEADADGGSLGEAPRRPHRQLDAATRAARSHFDREAAGYESSRRYRALGRPRAAAVELLRLTPRDLLLDLGCGSGATLRQLVGRIEHAVGVDISPGMIEFARRRAGGEPTLTFAVSDSACLPFVDDAFTAVLCAFSFHHYPGPAASVREMARVLVEGGRLVLTDASSDNWGVRLADAVARHREQGHVRFYRSKQLASLLEAGGFAQVAIRRPFGGRFMIATAVKSAPQV